MSYTEMAQLELMNAVANVTSQEDLDALRLTLFVDCAIKAGADYIVTEDLVALYLLQVGRVKTSTV